MAESPSRRIPARPDKTQTSFSVIKLKRGSLEMGAGGRIVVGNGRAAELMSLGSRDQ